MFAKGDKYHISKVLANHSFRKVYIRVKNRYFNTYYYLNKHMRCMSMNTFRRIMFFFLAIFVFAGAYQVSAAHFAVTDASFSSGNGTTFVITDTAVATTVTFNVTNTTLMEGNTPNDFDDVTNVTVAAVGIHGEHIILGTNVTSPLVLVAGNEGNLTYIVTVDLSFDRTLLNESVLGTGTTTLNISFDVWNLTGDGEYNETIIDTDQSFTFYTTGPKVTLKFLDINNNEKTTFQATDKVKIVCTRATSYTGISFNDTNISIAVPGGNSFDDLETSTTRAESSTDFEVEFTQTRELGDYTVACLSIDDNAFLNDTTNTTFTIVKKPPSGSSPFVNPDFKPPVATILVSAGSVSALGVLTEEGSSRLIMKEGAVSVTVQGTDYTLTLKDLTDTSATYTVDGATPFDVPVNAKETKNVDVTGDGTDDLTIVLHQIYNKRADTTFKLLSVQAAGPSPEPATNEGTQEPAAKETSPGSSTWGIVVVIFLIILAVLGGLHYFSARRRGGNGSSSSLRFNARDMGMQRSPEEPRTLTRN
mgnify:CR=1 FL=1